MTSLKYSFLNTPKTTILLAAHLWRAVNGAGVLSRYQHLNTVNSSYKGQISWDRIISLYSNLNKHVIRDSHFGYKGQFETEYVRHVKKQRACSPKPALFLSYLKLPFMYVLIQLTHDYYSYLGNIQ